MKAMLAILGVLAMTSTGFAKTTLGDPKEAKDRETLTDLAKIGMAFPMKDGVIRILIQDPDCGESLESGAVECTGIDLGVTGGKKFELKGDAASTLMVALYRSGATGDEGMGKLWMSAKTLECTASYAKVQCSAKGE